MSNSMITITSTDYTIENMRADWADGADYTAAQVMALADAEYAYLINHTHDVLRGWSYTGDGFVGPARIDAIALIGQLMVDAADHVIASMDEIFSEITNSES